MVGNLTFLDTQTGLYNNQYFYIRLDEEINRAQRYQYFLSIANIKFLIGDTNTKLDSTDFESRYNGLEELLPQISFLLRKHIRKVDIITRSEQLGFNLILPETSSDGAAVLCSRMKQNLEELLWEISKNRNYKVAVGVATYPLDARTDEDLLRKAAPNER